jgi:hypothetical protein
MRCRPHELYVSKSFTTCPAILTARPDYRFRALTGRCERLSGTSRGFTYTGRYKLRHLFSPAGDRAGILPIDHVTAVIPSARLCYRRQFASIGSAKLLCRDTLSQRPTRAGRLSKSHAGFLCRTFPQFAMMLPAADYSATTKKTLAHEAMRPRDLRLWFVAIPISRPQVTVSTPQGSNPNVPLSTFSNSALRREDRTFELEQCGQTPLLKQPQNILYLPHRKCSQARLHFTPPNFSRWFAGLFRSPTSSFGLELRKKH